MNQWLAATLCVTSLGPAPEPSGPQAQGRAGQETHAVEVEVLEFEEDYAEERGEALAVKWRTRLAEPDLDLREQQFERLIELGPRNPDLVALLEEWSTDAYQPDLAWTARLALRELRSPPAGPGPSPQASQPDGPTTHPIKVDLERLFGPGAHGHVPDVRFLRSGESFESLEALLAEHPELQGVLPPQLMPNPAPDTHPGQPAPPTTAQPEAFERWFGETAVTQPTRTDVLGVYVHKLSPNEARTHGLEPGRGLAIERVQPDTIADRLGLRPGTVMLELNETPLVNTGDISLALSRIAAGGEVRILVLDRWGRPRVRAWRPAPTGAPVDTPSPPAGRLTKPEPSPLPIVELPDGPGAGDAGGR